MKYGPTISDIRKAKKISLKNLLQDQMTPSSYSRFVDGKTETSVNNFVALLENLNVTFDEYLYINNGYQNSRYDQLYRKLTTALKADDAPALIVLVNQINGFAQSSPDNLRMKNLLDMAMLALNHVQGDPLNPTAREDLVKYLINCETWTHYEIMIFYNFIFITLVKITMFYLEHGKVLEALESLMDLRDFDIQEEFLFERTMYKFVAGETYTITNANRIKAIDDALNIFQAAGSTHQVNRLVDHMKLVVKANQFHNDDFDALIEKWGGTPSTKTPTTTTVS
ncbi:Rgg/GadR/MutR family transcriptional regulator [Limosilactobacillus fermentum]|uniref:Rgg/GadR/MutR family transcriptional regulator n=1 Tax=Limosilactobacillus fermentum TaxID=1613 RepID=UPI0021A5FDA3|nr:Rgg/GadR/MutR family transcriptional regulator [Limosilactobacillus fermentum]MCT2872206.1 Rgg/GadR/MutR family transcriptional regulator [Limosilactobacillus fermentum]